MSIPRLATILLGALLVMLAVVVLRTQTARIEHQTSVLDRQAVRLWQELRSREMELARLRSPVLIRARVAEAEVSGSPDGTTLGDAGEPNGAPSPG